MIPLATNIIGETLPVLQPQTTDAVLIDGTSAHAESLRLGSGVYRLAVRSSVDSAGVMVTITTAGTSATTSTGMFMANGSIEYVVLEQDAIVSVIDGILNITPFK